MTDGVVSVLHGVMTARDAGSYLAAQDEVVPQLRQEYEALCKVARQHADAAVRWEALQMVSLIRHPDHRSVLLDVQRNDPEGSVRDCAEALVFRSIVRESVVNSGRLSPEKLAAFDQDVRREAAASFFGGGGEEGEARDGNGEGRRTSG